MSDTALKIALILTAYDKMSQVINSSTANAKKQIKEVQKSFAEGYAMMGAGFKFGQKILGPAVDAFADAQEAGLELKATMMGPGGVLNEETYKKIYSYSNHLSDLYKGSTASYLEMARVLKQNRLNEEDILGGTGEAVAKLSDLFKMAPNTTAAFAAHMKNDMGVVNSEMDGMMDLISRLHDSGIGVTGADAVNEMNEFFGKASLGAQNLGEHGLEASKQIGALGGMFIARGLSGATVGTNFRRIFDGIRDAEKLDKANAVAAQFGKHLTLYDKDHKFLGMDNFVKQIGALEDLNPQAITAILKPFGGKQGLSTDFLEFLSKFGVHGYKEFLDKINQQATYTEKLNVQMKGLNYEQGAMQTSWTNLKASFGSSMEPILTLFYQTINKIIVSIREFLDEYPKVGKFASAFIALSSAGLMLFGVIKIIQGIRAAMIALNITMAMNPFIAIAMAIILAASLIYTYWDEISDFFDKLWNGQLKWLQVLIGAFAPFIAIPLVLIKSWEKVKEFFLDLGDSIWNVFVDINNWIETKLVNMFGEAGKNIVKSIAEGIWAGAELVINPINFVVQKIRDYFPFSPAKQGPLRDIHRVKLIETVAQSVKPNSLVNAIKKTTGLALNVLNKPTGLPSNSGSYNAGGFNFSITIHNLSGGATREDAALLGNEMERRFDQWMKKYKNQQVRIAF